MTIIRQYKLIREEPSSFLFAEVGVDGSGFGLFGDYGAALAAKLIDLFSLGLLDQVPCHLYFGVRSDGAH